MKLKALIALCLSTVVSVSVVAAPKSKDKDGDGKISKVEFIGKLEGEKAAKKEKIFAKRDKNADGFLAGDELGGKK